MTHSRIYPVLVLNVVNLLFYTSFYWKSPSTCHVFVKWPVCTKLLTHASLHYSLRHIGHTQSHTSNEYFKLVVALL